MEEGDVGRHLMSLVLHLAGWWPLRLVGNLPSGVKNKEVQKSNYYH